jgi:lipopolysaccharide transport system permease protein
MRALPAEEALSTRFSGRSTKNIRPPSFEPWRLWSAGRELLSYRDLLVTLSLHRLSVRYKQSILGWAWALVQPLALMLIYTIIFSVVTRMPDEGVPYAVFVYAALLPWTYFATIMTNSATCLVNHSQLITKVYFPREILPLTYVAAAFVDFLVGAVVLAGMMVYYHLPVTRYVLYLIPIMAVLSAFGLALALFLSVLQVRVRDIGLAMPLVMQVWMFATPVVYPLSAVPSRLRDYYDVNPLAGTIESFRRVLLQSKPPEYSSFAEASVIALVLLPVAYLFFKYREASMADFI